MRHPLDQEVLVHLYLAEDMSPPAIARKFGVQPATVKKYLRKAGVYPKPPLPAHVRFTRQILFGVGPRGCWEWQGYFDSCGYGQFKVKNKKLLAHRYAYELLVGPIEPHLEIDHLCRNRRCVNPAHLEPVTHLENMARGGHALKTHCPHSHPYDAANTYVKKTKSGTGRMCKTCLRLRRQAKAA